MQWLKSMPKENILSLTLVWMASVLLTIGAALHFLLLARDIPHSIRIFFDVVTLIGFGYFVAKQMYVIRVNEVYAVLGDESPVDRESIPFIMRQYVLERDNYTCVWCGRVGTQHKDHEGNTPNCDHIIPCSKGGKTIPSNLATSCRTCNLMKSDKTPVQFIQFLKRRIA